MTAKCHRQTTLERIACRNARAWHAGIDEYLSEGVA